MDNLMSPKSVYSAVGIAMENIVYEAVSNAVSWDVFRDAYYDVCEPVDDAVSVYGDVDDAVLVNWTLHSNIDKFIKEIEQNWSVACTS